MLPGLILSQSCDSGHYYFNKAEVAFTNNIDSCIYYSKVSIKEYTKCENWESLLDSYGSLVACYYRLFDIDKCEYYQLKANNIIENYRIDEKLQINHINNEGVISNYKGDYRTSLIQHFKSLDIGIKYNVDEYIIAADYENIAANYNLLGDLKNAIAFTKKASLARSKSNFYNYKVQHLVHNQLKLGRYYKKIGEQDSSLHYLNNVIDFGSNYENNLVIQEYKYIALLESASIFLNSNNNAFFATIKEANRLQLINRLNIDRYKLPILFARHYASKGDMKQTNFYISRADSLINLKFENNCTLVKSEYYYNCSLIYKYSNQKTEQIKTLEHALECIVPTENNIELLEIKIISDLLNLNWFDFADRDTNYKLLNRALQNGKKSLSLLQSKVSKIDILNTLDNLITTGIEHCYLISPNNKKSFKVSEANKANLLIEHLQETTAKGFANIPDSLLSKEKSLTIDIAFYQRKIAEIKSLTDNDSTDKLARWENRLFELNRQHTSLIHLFEEKYPAYFQIKYQDNFTGVEDIQNHLDRKSAFIEYFVAKENLYIFAISKNQYKSFKVPYTDSLDNAIQSVLDIINNPPSGEGQFVDFISSSGFVYGKLIKPCIDFLGPNIKNLIVVPDGELSYLPFEVLLSNSSIPKTTDYNPRNLSYLFEDYNINYQYSGSLWLTNLEHDSDAQNDFIGFAPSYGESIASETRDCTGDHLYNLYCADNELQTINQLFNGKAIRNTSANKDVFMNEVSDYKIIHLATHACVDEVDPMFNKIYLSDDYVSNWDLQTLDLKAELAVLSACNTGSGKFIKGEGVMSLSKGFLHAGCPSTVMSLWSVDDCATSEIMINLYKFLKDGNRKDDALKKAKLSYLEHSDKVHSHPYYWAAFVQLGTTSPINFSNQKNWWLFVILGTAGILLALFYFLRKRPTNQT